MTGRRRMAAAALAVATALTLAACSGDPAPAPSGAGEPPTAMPSAPEATAQPSDPAAEPTCETIIPPSLVAEFQGYGMTAQEEDFRVGEHVVDGGLQCTWGNHDVATDHVQIYGWAPIDATRAVELQAYLESQGWVREEGEGVVYITEDPDFAMTVDEHGYGMTYAFGDGHVLLADTRQGLALVTWR